MFVGTLIVIVRFLKWLLGTQTYPMLNTYSMIYASKVCRNSQDLKPPGKFWLILKCLKKTNLKTDKSRKKERCQVE